MTRTGRTAGHYREDLENWRTDEVVAGVRIHSQSPVCARCSGLLGEYRLHEAPDFPPDRCEDAYGCSAWWEPMFADEFDRPED